MKIRENHEEVNHTLVNNQDRGGSVRAKGDAGDSLGSTSPRLLREVSMQEGVLMLCQWRRLRAAPPLHLRPWVSHRVTSVTSTDNQFHCKNEVHLPAKNACIFNATASLGTGDHPCLCSCALCIDKENLCHTSFSALSSLRSAVWRPSP